MKEAFGLAGFTLLVYGAFARWVYNEAEEDEEDEAYRIHELKRKLKKLKSQYIAVKLEKRGIRRGRVIRVLGTTLFLDTDKPKIVHGMVIPSDETSFMRVEEIELEDIEELRTLTYPIGSNVSVVWE